MFFERAKQARMQARLETIRTGVRHHVVKTRKYLCPSNEYFGRDYITGFTIVIR
jgi:hypothetical protein